LLVLTAMAFALGIDMPLSAAQVTVVSTTTVKPVEWKPDQVVQEMAPWRGLVAVKRRSAHFTDHLRNLKYFWDMTKCSTASTAIKSMIDLYMRNLDTLGLDNATKLKYNTILNNAKEEQSTLEPNVIISELPSEPSSPSEADTSCSPPPFVMSEDLCLDLHNEATEVADSALTTQKNTLSTAILKIMNIVDKFSSAKSQLHNFLAQFQQKQLPTDLISTFKCALRKGSCKSEKDPIVHPIAAAKVISQNVSGLQLQVATSCPDNVTDLGQYQLVAFPYQEGAHLKQLVLANESSRVWITPQHKSLSQEPTCHRTSSGIVCLRSSEAVQPTTARIRYSGTPTWKYTPVSHNELLVYAKKAAGSLECLEASNNANYTLAGTYKVHLPPKCSFYLNVDSERHLLRPQGIAPGASPELPLILPVENEMLPVQYNSIISEYPYAILWEHFSTNWPYYAVVLILSFPAAMGAMFFCSIMCRAWKRLHAVSKAQRGTRPPPSRQKKVYIRNPLLR
jgi:hypothetical protein